MAQKQNILLRLAAALLLVSLLLIGCRYSAIRTEEDLAIYPDLPRNHRDLERYARTDDGVVTFPGAVQGIDVSAHQQEIDWEQVRADGISFVILQIGYRGYGQAGTLNEDARFEENYAGAREAGLSVGVYFYSQATTVEEAQAEADYVLDLLDGRDLELPVFYDWEEVAEGRTKGFATRQVTDFAKTFCTTIYNAGYGAGVYFNQEYGYTIIRLDELQGFAYWLAEYRSWQSFSYNVHFWQYTGSGSVAGIDLQVDRVLMYTDDGEETGE